MKPTYKIRELKEQDLPLSEKKSEGVILIFPLKKVILQFENQKKLCDLGDIIRLHQPLSFKLSRHKETESAQTKFAYYFRISDDFFQDEVWGAPFIHEELNILKTSIPTIMKFIGLAEHAIQDYNDARTLSDELAYYHLKILCIHLYRTYNNFSKEYRTASVKEDIEMYEAIRSFIYSHYQEDLTNKELSRRFFISEKKLISLFSKYHNATPHQVLIMRRLSVAKDFILNGENITQAATQVGYHNYSTFYRQFKKYFQMSPENYFKKFGGT